MCATLVSTHTHTHTHTHGQTAIDRLFYILAQSAELEVAAMHVGLSATNTPTVFVALDVIDSSLT